MSVVARSVRRTVALYGGLLALVWGGILPGFLMLDAIAAQWARWTGIGVGLGGTLLAYGLTHLRLRRRTVPHLAFRAALDVAVTVSLAAIVAWQIHQLDGRVPYVEAFSILLIEVATGWAAAVGIYVSVRRRLRALPGATHVRGLPGVRTVYVVGAVALGVFASVSLSVGSSGRAAGALDRQAAAQLDHLADLFAAAVRAAPDEASRRRALDASKTLLHTRASLWKPGQLPPTLRAAGTPARWASPDPDQDGRLIALLDGGRSHWARRATPAGVVWVSTAANVRPPVRAPDDAPAMLILALLVLGAPAAAWVVGQDVRAELGQVTADLQAMAPDARVGGPAGVPAASNDEVGDLVHALNGVVQHFADQNRAVAEALDAAEAGDRARARFINAASHELRTPLNTITGFCHLLKSDPALQPEQAEDVAAIADAAAQLLGHVDEILDLGRIEAGLEEPLALALVDLNALVARVVDRANPNAAVPLTIHGVLGGPVRADARRIQQIVENLVSNAIKFTGEGHIQVHVGPGLTSDAVRVSVVDTGPGIDPSELEAVFDEFYRVQSQRTVAGTGLGLPIARRLAERHGGRLWAESTLGEGSAFHLDLPVGGPA